MPEQISALSKAAEAERERRAIDNSRGGEFEASKNRGRCKSSGDPALCDSTAYLQTLTEIGVRRNTRLCFPCHRYYNQWTRNLGATKVRMASGGKRGAPEACARSRHVNRFSCDAAVSGVFFSWLLAISMTASARRKRNRHKAPKPFSLSPSLRQAGKQLWGLPPTSGDCAGGAESDWDLSRWRQQESMDPLKAAGSASACQKGAPVL